MVATCHPADLDLSRVFGARGRGLAERVVTALRAAVPVEEIWVFGSCARGAARGDSDLDLLVVLADEHGLARPTLACFQAVNHLPECPPADVLTVTKSRWSDERARPFGLFGEVVREGVCVYAK